MNDEPSSQTVSQEQARREAFEQLEALAERVRARNADLTAEEAEQLADEITRDAIQRMIDEGKVIFQF